MDSLIAKFMREISCSEKTAKKYLLKAKYDFDRATALYWDDFRKIN